MAKNYLEYILFVIVLYKSNYKETKTYVSLLKKYNKQIYIYDNSPTPQDIHYKNIIYIHDPKNSGLSVAYNKAAQYAKDNGYKWILLLDQDTTFEDGAIEKYIEAIKNNPDIKLFAPKHKIKSGLYISPTKYYLKYSRPSKKVQTGLTKFSKASPINSGMLINVNAYWEVGGYDNEVTLDFSDIRFIEKFKNNYNSYYIIDSTCIQDFSVDEIDTNKLLNRYIIYCKCAKACYRQNMIDSIAYFFVVFKRCISLLIQTKNISFLKAFINYYIKK